MKQEIWTIGRILQWTEQYFHSKGVDTPRLDGEVLLSHVLGKERIYLYTHYDQPLEQHELDAYRPLVKQRVEGHSVAAIVGYKEFMGLSFKITEDVLCPRPDTETLVEYVLSVTDAHETYEILDVCSGPGTILLSLLHYLPQARGLGLEFSPQALAIGLENQRQLDLEARACMVQSNMFSALGGAAYEGLVPQRQADGTHRFLQAHTLGRGQILEGAWQEYFDIIVSNPPYITSQEMKDVSAEVLHEPHMALWGGDDGLDFYRLLAANSASYLKKGGFLAMEIGMNQEEAVKELLESSHQYEDIQYIPDLASINRVVVAKKKG